MLFIPPTIHYCQNICSLCNSHPKPGYFNATLQLVQPPLSVLPLYTVPKRFPKVFMLFLLFSQELCCCTRGTEFVCVGLHNRHAFSLMHCVICGSLVSFISPPGRVSSFFVYQGCRNWYAVATLFGTALMRKAASRCPRHRRFSSRWGPNRNRVHDLLCVTSCGADLVTVADMIQNARHSRVKRSHEEHNPAYFGTLGCETPCPKSAHTSAQHWECTHATTSGKNQKRSTRSHKYNRLRVS